MRQHTFNSLRLLTIAVFLLLATFTTQAQDELSSEDQAAYDAALALILEARDTNATELRLNHMRIRYLPPEIGQLQNLEVLYLQSNYFSQLPPEIGQLSNLRELYLYHNALTELPPEIGQLQNLVKLDIHHNDVLQYPYEITQLNNLEILNLSGSDTILAELPP